MKIFDLIQLITHRGDNDMKEIDLLAEYVDYKTANGCLDWNGFKSVKQRQEIIEDFDAYVESKSKKSSLDNLLSRLDNQIESMETGLSCIKEDVEYLDSLIKDVKNEIKEIKNNF